MTVVYTAQRHADRMALYEKLQRVLRGQTKRKQRDFDAEVRAVHLAANTWAGAYPDDCVRVSLEHVKKCDTMAAGHIDWSTKFPLYVSEAVYGLGRLPDAASR